ncbi:MAG TPA: CocE/NonD family hydrolase, partial [Gemmatimonadales bacterium]|nr:CocE/NonD family hydrolase [Gemmatimonadales bacterium]
MRLCHLVIAALLPALSAPGASAQEPADSEHVRVDTLIPMRDGVRLFTVIVTPRGATAPLPLLMTRTPYSAATNARMARGAKHLGLDGYILVFQDIRGRFRSEGTFDMNRPPHSGHAGTDESTDTYDTIDWLVHHVPNTNGRVGVLGVSY